MASGPSRLRCDIQPDCRNHWQEEITCHWCYRLHVWVLAHGIGRLGAPIVHRQTPTRISTCQLSTYTISRFPFFTTVCSPWHSRCWLSVVESLPWRFERHQFNPLVNALQRTDFCLLVMHIWRHSFWRLRHAIINIMMIIITITINKSIAKGMIATMTNAPISSFLWISFQVYLCEIVHPDIRGLSGGTYSTLNAVGYSLTLLLGAVLPSWRLALLILGAIHLPILVLIFFVPESPTWLIRKGRTEEAELAFKRWD